MDCPEVCQTPSVQAFFNFCDLLIMTYNYEEPDNRSEDPDDNDADIEDPERRDICQTCLAPILNLGKEAADIYRIRQTLVQMRVRHLFVIIDRHRILNSLKI